MKSLADILKSSSTFSSRVLTRAEVIEALTLDYNQGVGAGTGLDYLLKILPFEVRDFIHGILLPFLNVTRDDPQFLEDIIKACINVIYYLTITHYGEDLALNRGDGNQFKVRYNDNAKQAKEKWLKTYEQWSEITRPYSTRQQFSEYRAPSVIDFSSFGPCLLAAIPEDGTVFIPHDRFLGNLQRLARKYNLINTVQNNSNEMEMENMSEKRKFGH